MEIYNPLSRARELCNAGKFEEAIKYFDEAIGIDPDPAIVYLEKSMALEKLDKIEDTMSCYDKIIELDPDIVFSYPGKAELFVKLGMEKEALECLEKLDGIKPSESTLWAFYKRSIIQYNLGKLDEAMNSLNRVLELDPNHTNAFFSKGVLFGDFYEINKDSDMLKKSIECYDEVIKLDPNNIDALYNKGLDFQLLGKFEESINCYDEIIKIDDSTAYAFFSKGVSLDAIGKFEKALSCYDKALEIGSDKDDYLYDKASTLYNKAKALYVLDRVEDSKYFLNEARKLKSDLPGYDELNRMLSDRLQFNRDIHKKPDK